MHPRPEATQPHRRKSVRTAVSHTASTVDEHTVGERLLDNPLAAQQRDRTFLPHTPKASPIRQTQCMRSVCHPRTAWPTHLGVGNAKRVDAVGRAEAKDAAPRVEVHARPAVGEGAAVLDGRQSAEAAAQVGRPAATAAARPSTDVASGVGGGGGRRHPVAGAVHKAVWHGCGRERDGREASAGGGGGGVGVRGPCARRGKEADRGDGPARRSARAVTRRVQKRAAVRGGGDQQPRGRRRSDWSVTASVGPTSTETTARIRAAAAGGGGVVARCTLIPQCGEVPRGWPQ